MAKAPDAFRTISEVSESLDTPAHVLRFWESKFTQVKPVKRAGGRRYYRPEDLALLGGIKVLLHDHGMTIKGAQKVLREQGVKAVAALSPAANTDDGDVIDAKAEQRQAPSETVAPDAQTPEAAASLPDDVAPSDVQAPEPDVTPPDLATGPSDAAKDAATTEDEETDTAPPAPEASATHTPPESPDDPASVAADNVVAMPGPPREEPAPRNMPPPRALAWLAASDRAAVRRNAAAIVPVRDRLAAVHLRMTKV